jgi:hypothetical protein
MNLLMASCSYLEAKNVVALTASRHYHYSNISKVSYYLCKNEEGYCNFFSDLTTLFCVLFALACFKDCQLGELLQFFVRYVYDIQVSLSLFTR